MKTRNHNAIKALILEVQKGYIEQSTINAAEDALDDEAKAARSERKIVQIAEGGIEGKPGVWDADAWITGLCGDGSVWRLHGGGPDGEWYRMPPIPHTRCRDAR